MTDIIQETQPERLAKAFSHLLEIVDQWLALDEVPLSERPIRATTDLLKHGFVVANIGEEVKVDRLWEYFGEPWFRAMFTGVEEWYRSLYGPQALNSRNDPPIEGVVLVRSVPFLLQVPTSRIEVETTGKTAWFYFEAGLGDGEDPRKWLVGDINFERLSVDELHKMDSDLYHVTSSLRIMHHHLLGSGNDETQAGLRASIRSYLEAAARRLRMQEVTEFTFAWMDLQMAAEAAIKLVIFRTTGQHPRRHELVSDLLNDLGAISIVFDRNRLANWPQFKTISNRRYGTERDSGASELYEAYKLILDLVVSCVRTIVPPLASGAGLLLHVAPYLIDDPLPSQRRASINAEEK